MVKVLIVTSISTPTLTARPPKMTCAERERERERPVKPVLGNEARRGATALLHSPHERKKERKRPVRGGPSPQKKKRERESE